MRRGGVARGSAALDAALDFDQEKCVDGEAGAAADGAQVVQCDAHLRGEIERRVRCVPQKPIGEERIELRPGPFESHVSAADQLDILNAGGVAWGSGSQWLLLKQSRTARSPSSALSA